MRDIALSPRLAAMVVHASELGYGLAAAELAVLISEQGLGGSALDLDERLRRWRHERGDRAEGARRLARSIAQGLKGKGNQERNGERPDQLSSGLLLSFAFPDRIALARGGRGRFVMANGRGAELAETDPLAASSMLVIADLTGSAAKARILAAAEVTRAEIEATFPEAIVTEDSYQFDRANRQVRLRRQTRLGALVLDEQTVAKADPARLAAALAEGVRMLGLAALPFSREAAHLRQRLGFLHRSLGGEWPDVSDEALLARLEDWFTPFQSDVRSLADLDRGGLTQGLMSLVPHALQRQLDSEAPTHFEAPTGQRHPIDYDGDEPRLAIRVQELFGLKKHPAICGGRLPLLLDLTSPAHRPIQTTRDLPGFWAGSWRDVRAEMRGRYPKHPWPDNPAEAEPTHRAKPRGT